MHGSSVFMDRCINLAEKGKGLVAPNPLVGAVLVYRGRIIGEGYHDRFGGPHAEVNAINDAIWKGHEEWISQATLFVSLEPCSHQGKTPPCADLIIEKNIPAVVIGSLDPNPVVNGNGLKKLKAAGIEAILLEDPATAKRIQDQLRPFSRFLLNKKPYVILKWAETADGYIGSGQPQRLKISNAVTDRLVHKWRTQTRSILVGKNTAILDDPLLNNRYWPGPAPVKMVLAPAADLPPQLNIFNGEDPVICFNYKKSGKTKEAQFIQLNEEGSAIAQILDHLYQAGVPSILVEGGAVLLNAFIREESWDEARIIRADTILGKGLPAPRLPKSPLYSRFDCLNDQISCYYREP